MSDAVRPVAYRARGFVAVVGACIATIELLIGAGLMMAAPGAQGTQGWMYSIGGMTLVFGLITSGLVAGNLRRVEMRDGSLRFSLYTAFWSPDGDFGRYERQDPPSRQFDEHD